ncbi:VWA domain-containing protein [Pseudomonas denitrificans (nom. rej.)]|uniref:VWA domain-containing protein n=1 Tax=Pseudomonas denitrificans TaxID=43306 RepID=A0A9X7MYT2_PSEDE|nr:VWA domain-containing protein [Pseudomonas denitrificans (nom. rej.)]QEY71806.1 VWA domain-containing protein [Pseudomonas denitrificans (nom. rej.)]
MWQLDYPWVLALWPLGLLAIWLLPEQRVARTALRVPFFCELRRVHHAPLGKAAARWQGWLNQFNWCLLLLALARPAFYEPPQMLVEPARDLVLAIDLSQSMATRDYRDPQGRQLDRLTAVKQVLHDFIARRSGDRLALVVFGSGAYVQAPLTLDHKTLLRLLDDSAIGMAGPNTAIGDAIGLSLRVLAGPALRAQQIVLLTDGSDNASAVPPERAVELAVQRGVVLQAIAIGDSRGQGAEKVDSERLQVLAETTGGRFFRAEDSRALADVYAELDRSAPHPQPRLGPRPRHEGFYWPLGLALLLTCCGHLLAAGAVRLPSLRRA